MPPRYPCPVTFDTTRPYRIHSNRRASSRELPTSRPDTGMMLHVPASTRRAAAVVLGAVGVVMFGWLLESIAGDWGLADLDWPVLDGLAAHRAAPLTAAAEALRAASSPLVILGAAAAIALAWGVARRELARPLLLLGACLADLLLVTGARLWVGRARPPAWFEAVGGTDAPAFPAVHTSGVLTLLFVALYLAYSRRASARGLGSAAVCAGVVALAVAACDLYLGRHWLTDVVAAWSISIVVLAAVVWTDSLRLPAMAPAPPPTRAAGSQVAGSRSPADT